MTMFAAVDANGNTPSDNPKLDAYKYLAMLQYRGRITSLEVSSNGCYTVKSAGLLPLTFYPRKTEIERCLTLGQARAHCGNPATSTANYFDGYVKQ